jgi:hypothetical protein
MMNSGTCFSDSLNMPFADPNLKFRGWKMFANGHFSEAKLKQGEVQEGESERRGCFGEVPDSNFYTRGTEKFFST